MVKNRDTAYVILAHYISKSEDVNLLRRLIPWTMAVFGVDQGQLFQIAYARCKSGLDQQKTLVIWMQGLLTRHAKYVLIL